MQEREIEVKAYLKNFEEIRKKLELLGCSLSEPVKQEDIIYLPNGVDIDDVKKGTNSLRIRKEKGKYIFNLKQRMDVSLDCIERETVIADPQAMNEIIKLLGFYEFQKLTKTRRKCKYNEYEICLDEVEGLGAFVEVEKISSEDGEKVQQELFQFLESLGVKCEERATRGYDILLHQKYTAYGI